MGGGTTTIAVFFDGNLVFTDSVPVGGGHVTNDIARGLSTPVAHAERMKTLYGSAIAASADERELITVPQVGEEDEGQANHVPKSLLVGIIAPRLEETFELVRDRLEATGFDKIAGRRVVLTGGACQLPGARELAGAHPRQADPHRPAVAHRGLGRGDRWAGLLDRRRSRAFRPFRARGDAAAGRALHRGAERALRPLRSLAEGEFLRQIAASRAGPLSHEKRLHRIGQTSGTPGPSEHDRAAQQWRTT